MRLIGLKFICLPLAAIGLSGLREAEAANPVHVARLLKTNQCPLCDLSGANLEDANLFGANLVNANLKGANLTGANLGSANLSDADLTGANLSRVYLYQATLDNTNLSGANLNQAYLKGAVLAGNVNLNRANLQGVNLSRVNLAGISFQETNLRDADLSYATLTGIRQLGGDRTLGGLVSLFGNLSNYLCDSSFSTFAAEALSTEETKRLGFELGVANLYKANLTGANLTGAMLAGGELQQVNLREANLSGACLRGANLTNAVLDGAELKNARLEESLLQYASLKGVKNANLQGSYASPEEAKVASAQKSAEEAIDLMIMGQYYYFVANEKFATNWADLELDIAAETEFYKYQMLIHPDQKQGAMLVAVPRKNGFKTYVGFLHGIVLETEENAGDYLSITCVSQDAKPLLPQLPAQFSSDIPMDCPDGFQLIEEAEPLVSQLRAAIAVSQSQHKKGAVRLLNGL